MLKDLGQRCGLWGTLSIQEMLFLGFFEHGKAIQFVPDGRRLCLEALRFLTSTDPPAPCEQPCCWFERGFQGRQVFLTARTTPAPCAQIRATRGFDRLEETFLNQAGSTHSARFASSFFAGRSEGGQPFRDPYFEKPPGPYR